MRHFLACCSQVIIIIEHVFLHVTCVLDLEHVFLGEYMSHSLALSPLPPSLLPPHAPSPPQDAKGQEMKVEIDVAGEIVRRSA